MNAPALLDLTANGNASRSCAVRSCSQSERNQSPKGVLDSRNPSSGIDMSHVCEATFSSGSLGCSPDFETATEGLGTIREGCRGPALSISN